MYVCLFVCICVRVVYFHHSAKVYEPRCGHTTTGCIINQYNIYIHRYIYIYIYIYI